MKPPAPDDESRPIREAAFRLLAVRARSAQELRQRLARKGFVAELSEPVIAGLQADGYQSDEAFARQYAHEKRTQGWAPVRVGRELRARGIAASLADRVVGELYAGDDLVESVLPRALKRWQGTAGLPKQTRRRRLTGYLQRRGYNWETIRAVLQSAEQAERSIMDEESGDQ